MKAENVVNLLKNKLPQLVDDFTSNAAILSASPSMNLVTVNTATPHSLAVDDNVFINGLLIPIPITSIERVGIVGLVTTSVPHDLTNNSQVSVRLSGANEPEFNGTFEYYNCSDRFTFRIIMENTGTTSATGNLLGDNIGSPVSAITGNQKVNTVNSETSFTYDTGSIITQPIIIEPNASIRGDARVTGAVTFERMLDAYTKQLENQAWLFVVLGDAVANKSRREDTDATNNLQKSHFFNAKLNQSLDLYVVYPSTNSIGGMETRDRCEELLQPICQCVLMSKPDSLLASKDFNPLQIAGHGFQAYNGAYYVHRYAFELVVQLGFDDTVGYEPDVAFRDIILNQKVSTGEGELLARINLDDDIGD